MIKLILLIIIFVIIFALKAIVFIFEIIFTSVATMGEKKTYAPIVYNNNVTSLKRDEIPCLEDKMRQTPSDELIFNALLQDIDFFVHNNTPDLDILPEYLKSNPALPGIIAFETYLYFLHSVANIFISCCRTDLLIRLKIGAYEKALSHFTLKYKMKPLSEDDFVLLFEDRCLAYKNISLESKKMYLLNNDIDAKTANASSGLSTCMIINAYIACDLQEYIETNKLLFNHGNIKNFYPCFFVDITDCKFPIQIDNLKLFLKLFDSKFCDTFGIRL